MLNYKYLKQTIYHNFIKWINILFLSQYDFLLFYNNTYYGPMWKKFIVFGGDVPITKAFSLDSKLI